MSWWIFDLPIIFKAGKGKKQETKSEESMQAPEFNAAASPGSHAQMNEFYGSENVLSRSTNNAHLQDKESGDVTSAEVVQEGGVASKEAEGKQTSTTSIAFGVGSYFGTLIWTCTRMHAPSLVAFIACFHGRTSSEISRTYHIGWLSDEGGEKRFPEWTLRKYLSSLATNLLGLISTIITIYQTCTLPSVNAQRAT